MEDRFYSLQLIRERQMASVPLMLRSIDQGGRRQNYSTQGSSAAKEPPGETMQYIIRSTHCGRKE